MGDTDEEGLDGVRFEVVSTEAPWNTSIVCEWEVKPIFILKSI